MEIEEKALSLLKKHQLKKTSGRMEILQCLMTIPHAVSHSDIEEQLGAKLDRVTIYRTLNSFEEAGITHKVMDLEGISKFALCSNCDHHHHHDEHIHFECTNCKNTFCLDNELTPSLNMPDGYSMSGFDITVQGICKNCNQ